MRVRQLRAAKGEPVDPVGQPPPLNELPWEVAQKQFGVQGADFLGEFGRVLLKGVKKQLLVQPIDYTAESGGLHDGFG